MSNIDIIKEIEAEQLKATVEEFNVGDTVRVKYLGTDEKGRQNLSMKDADPENTETAE